MKGQANIAQVRLMRVGQSEKARQKDCRKQETPTDTKNKRISQMLYRKNWKLIIGN